MLITRKVQVLIGALCFWSLLSLADKNNSSKFTRYICDVRQKDLLTNVSCWLKHINRHTTYLNFRGLLTRGVHSAIVHLVLYKKFNVYRPTLINVKEEFCDMYTKKSSVTYMRLIREISAPYWNINHSCPYFDKIIVKDLPLNVHKIPLGWPAGEYRADASLRLNNYTDLSVLLQFYFQISEKF